jgi:hypothetical protein
VLIEYIAKSLGLNENKNNQVFLWSQREYPCQKYIFLLVENTWTNQFQNFTVEEILLRGSQLIKPNLEFMLDTILLSG